MPLDSVLRELDEDDRSTDIMADGSDDLGMNSDYDELDSSVESILNGIIVFNNKTNGNKNLF